MAPKSIFHPANGSGMGFDVLHPNPKTKVAISTRKTGAKLLSGFLNGVLIKFSRAKFLRGDARLRKLNGCWLTLQYSANRLRCCKDFNRLSRGKQLFPPHSAIRNSKWSGLLFRCSFWDGRLGGARASRPNLRWTNQFVDGFSARRRKRRPGRPRSPFQNP